MVGDGEIGDGEVGESKTFEGDFGDDGLGESICEEPEAEALEGDNARKEELGSCSS